MNNIQRGMMNSVQIKAYLLDSGISKEELEQISLSIADRLLSMCGMYLKGWFIARDMHDKGRSVKQIIRAMKTADLSCEDKRMKL